ncbi:MAG: hypothetical protein IT243_01385 [Bacteroidia bacterium]|nr:hypothetical protein [Bacteroidia bacterium]
MKTSNFKLQTSNFKLQTFVVLLIFLPGISFKSKAQSSCCHIVTTSEVDCNIVMNIKCNGVLLNCSDPKNNNISVPPPLFYGKCQGGLMFSIQPGIKAYPSVTTTTFDSTLCLCDIEIELIGIGFNLNGKTIFNSSHTSEHLDTIDACCPGGIDVLYDPVNCTLLITAPTCP